MRKKAGILFFLRIIKIVLGILNLSVAAKYFGVSLDRDIWLLSLSTVLVIDMAIWGPVNETFRAKFITIRETQGEKIALNKMNSLLVFTFFASLAIVMLVIFWSEIFAKIIAPGYTKFEISRLANMFVYIAPVLLINQLIQIGTSVLNAYDVFFVPEIASFGSSIFNIVLTIVLAPLYGIYALLIAYYAGVFLLLILIIFYINKLNKNVLANLIKSKFNTSFLTFILFALPFFLPYFFGQLSTIVEKSLASKMYIGAISSIDYARKFSEMFNNVLSSVLSTMLIPVLALHFSKQESKKFVFEFEQILRFGFLAIVLMVSTFSFAPKSLVSIIYPSLNAVDALTISELIMYYAWSAIAVFTYVISGIALMTHGKPKMYAMLGMITQIIIIIINSLGYRHFGLYIFPISLFGAHLISGSLMLIYFPVKENHIIPIVLKIAGIFGLVLITCYTVNYFLAIKNNYIQLFTTGLSSVLALVVGLYVFKMEEVNLLNNLVKKLK